MSLMLSNNRNNDLFDWFFNWDKDFYKFTRDEKDMYPYSVVENENGSITIVHNVVGLDKKDLKLSTNIIDGKGYIIIEGHTKDELTGKTYSINSKFTCDVNKCDLNKIKSTMKNGLLYITIEAKKKADFKTKFIDID